MKTFNVKKATNDIIEYLRDWFDTNGHGCNAIIGMSGGKDSTIAAKILVEALGKERVIGVSMPDKNQGINEADKICEWLGIKYICFPIDKITEAFDYQASCSLAPIDNGYLSKQSRQNIPPRVRMATLYAIGQSNNGRVINTCNLSENYIGYSTRYGDDAGDVSPLSFFTVDELLKIGDYLGIPYEWVHKVPDDGLPHSCPDEEKLGFTYEELDKWIRYGTPPFGYCHNNSYGESKFDKIERMHKMNEFKTRYMDCFRPVIEEYYA